MLVRCAAHHKLNDFEDYISEDKNWSLIKLHGSVNWHYTIPEYIEEGAFTQELPISDHALKCLAPASSLSDLRGIRNRYPALALPEGPEDRLVLPSRHVRWIGQKLRSAPEIDLLVIGYSGLDNEVLKRIGSADCKVRHMTIVNQSLKASLEVRERFRAGGIQPVWTETSEGDFGRWVDGGDLDKLVAQYGGPYPDAY